MPLLGVDPSTFSTVKEASLKPHLQVAHGLEALKSNVVCSRHAVAGIGMLMDHGTRNHCEFDKETGSGGTLLSSLRYANELTRLRFCLAGWILRDPTSDRNFGRGVIFGEFRGFMVQNMDFQ